MECFATNMNILYFIFYQDLEKHQSLYLYCF